MAKALTFEYVKQYFNDRGLTLISTIYKNSGSDLIYICKCGLETQTTFNSIRRGSFCKKCANKEVGNRFRYSFNYVYNYFRENGCGLLSTTYVNNRTHLNYVCSCGKPSTITFCNFKKGIRCKECANNRLRKQRKGSGSTSWISNREVANLRLIIRNKSRNLLTRTLKLIKTNKENSAKDLLGYTPKDLYDYLINHPNWKKVKNKKWHLDHIFPIKAFLDYRYN